MTTLKALPGLAGQPVVGDAWGNGIGLKREGRFQMMKLGLLWSW